MEKTIQKICKEIVDEYREDRNVLGVALFGSAVRGKVDRYSDIDIYILLKERGSYSRVNYESDQIRVDVILDTVRETEAFLKEDEHNVRRNTSHMLAHAKVLYQVGDHLSRTIDRAKVNLTLPTKSTEGETLMHKYSIDDFWSEVQRDLDKGDHTAFGIDSQLLINNIVELFLKLHGEFQRQPNEMNKTLSKLDAKFAGKIEGFYEANTIEARKGILGELVNYIFEISHGSLPQKWTIE